MDLRFLSEFFVHFEQLEASGFESVGHDTGKSSEEVVAEGGVFIASFAEGGSIEDDCSCEFEGSGVEIVVIGIDDPRPTEDVVFFEDLEGDILEGSGANFDGDTAITNEEEEVRGFIFFDEEFIASKDFEGCALFQIGDVLFGHGGKKRVFEECIF